MLISFSVGNFRSIGSEQTLNLVASNKIADHPSHLVRIPQTEKSVVRTAVVYGANSAGKSNLVRAMAFAQEMVKANERRVAIAEPFRFNSQFARLPTSFEFRFLTNGRVFTYGFDVKGRVIHEEWLSVLEGSDDRLIYDRDQEGHAHPAQDLDSLFPGDSAIGKTLTALASLPLTPHQLLLNRANALPEDAQGETLRAIIKWLTRDLLILLPDHRSTDILDRLSENTEFRRLAEEFLSSVGTGVDSLELTTEEIDAASFMRFRPAGRTMPIRRGRDGLDDVRPKPDDPNRFVSRRLYALHPMGDSSAALAFSEESDGTKQLLHLMPVLASSNDGTKVVVIDELDRSLHPLICWEFIRLFSETVPGANKQLIVTTHEAHLLNQDLLRRDEYWFVEKDTNQQTHLVSLSDFKVRNDLQLEKGYLHGRFGGIPIIGSMAEIEKLLSPSTT